MVHLDVYEANVFFPLLVEPENEIFGISRSTSTLHRAFHGSNARHVADLMRVRPPQSLVSWRSQTPLPVLTIGSCAESSARIGLRNLNECSSLAFLNDGPPPFFPLWWLVRGCPCYPSHQVGRNQRAPTLASGPEETLFIGDYWMRCPAIFSECHESVWRNRLSMP